MEQPFLYFNNLSKTIRANTSVIVDPYCNSYTVINLGLTLALANGVPLNAGVPGTNNGESVSFGGNYGEIFKGRIDINFPVGNTGEVLVIQKIYLL